MDATKFVESMLPSGPLYISIKVPEDRASRKGIIQELKRAIVEGPIAKAAFTKTYDVKVWKSFDDAWDNAPLDHQILSVFVS